MRSCGFGGRHDRVVMSRLGSCREDVHGPERADYTGRCEFTGGKARGTAVEEGKVSMAPTMIPGPATAVAFRSEVDPKWAYTRADLHVEHLAAARVRSEAHSRPLASEVRGRPG